ncbi:MAG: cytochrome c oxidase assembly factor Coa1 family protein [Planctomycetota bacterium]
MSQFPQADPSYAQPQKPKKGWFGRNWWWFIPILVLTPFCCCCGTCGGITYFSLQQVENMGAYKDSVAAAQASAEVQAELGTPIDAKGIIGAATSGGSFDAQQTTTGMSMTAVIPISGPKGSGLLYIDADGDAAGVNWTYTRREVVIDGSGKTIDLIPDASTPESE